MCRAGTFLFSYNRTRQFIYQWFTDRGYRMTVVRSRSSRIGRWLDRPVTPWQPSLGAISGFQKNRYESPFSCPPLRAFCLPQLEKLSLYAGVYFLTRREQLCQDHDYRFAAHPN